MLETIEQICEKFNYRIQPSMVYKWLSNFKEEDQLKALEILWHIEYFSHEDIIYQFDNSLSEIIKFVEDDTKSKQISRIIDFLLNSRIRLFNKLALNKKIILHPIGGTTKSGVNMIYPLTKTPAYNKYKKYFQLVTDEKKLEYKIKSGMYLVLFDDIVGSGDTLVKYYSSTIKRLLVETDDIKVFSLSVIYMADSQKKLNEINIRSYGNERKKAFSETGSVFGYRYRMRIIRDLAFRYGNNLYVTTNSKTKIEKRHNLGHNNSQALIVFAHSTPNNTLPIIWSSKNNWNPIFPRFSNDKINALREFKSDARRSMSLLAKMGFSNIFAYNKYSNIDLHLLMILKLKKRGKNKQRICQYLEISSKEYDNIVTKGKEKDIFGKDGEINILGNNIYLELQKLEKISKEKDTQTTIYMNNYENIHYLPKMFRGEL